MPTPPWGDHRLRIGSAEFERVVGALLTEAGKALPGFHLERQEPVRAPDGTYRIDVTVRFTQLGVDFLVLVECKDCARPVEREDVQVLYDKLRTAGAQKGMLFSANGFQKGAVQYARSHGIALVRLVEGVVATYETRALGTGPPLGAPGAKGGQYVGQFLSLNDDGSCRVSVLQTGRVEHLSKFLDSA